MNRPNELIKELQEFDEMMYGKELSRKECHELVNYIDELEEKLKQYKKGIFRACETLEILEHAHRENLTREPFTQEQWKEYLLKDE